MNESFWNTRYAQTESSYGNSPNEFFKEQLKKLPPGKLLLPGEGEGRNALFAAEMAWEVSAFDFSEVAKEKALSLARARNLQFNYAIGDVASITLPAAQYDSIALIYIHLPSRERQHLHNECMKALKPGGTIILEAFSMNQVNYSSGGPRDPALLYSLNELQQDFRSLEFEVAEECTIHLNEGAFHQGVASVVRLSAKKKM